MKSNNGLKNTYKQWLSSHLKQSEEDAGSNECTQGGWGGGTKVPLENNFELKCTQVNVLQNNATMTKASGDTRADQICRQCLDVLGM